MQPKWPQSPIPLFHQQQTWRVMTKEREPSRDETCGHPLCYSLGCYSIRHSGPDLQLHITSSVSVTGFHLHLQDATNLPLIPPSPHRTVYCNGSCSPPCQNVKQIAECNSRPFASVPTYVMPVPLIRSSFIS